MKISGGRNFSILFNESDREKNRPQVELQTVKAKGQAQDENYIIDKEGHEIWVLGESLLINDQKGDKFIVKDIINLQAKKQLQLFLTETEELLERIFDSTKDLPMIIINGSMKIIKANIAFLHLLKFQTLRF
ncbi:MAG: PAS domain S-box protein [Segetibacter sp.]